MKSKDKEQVSMKSLATLRGEIREAQCETNEEGRPQYLLPYSVGDSILVPGKQIITTDTLHEPDCLRFCPSNSSEKVEISLSGRYPFLFSRQIGLETLQTSRFIC
jgi:hypothetical protein